MKKTSNAKSRDFVEKLEPFKANNLSATRDDRLYIVWSYGWYPLFAYHFESCKWFENADKYSVSTSKQTSQCRPLGKETFKVSHETIKDLIQKR